MQWVRSLMSLWRLDPAKERQALVLSLLAENPRCSKYVLLASPSYKNSSKHFNCEVVVLASDLVTWLSIAGSVSSNDKSYMAAIDAVPIWLEQGDLDEPLITKLSPSFAEALHESLEYFIHHGRYRIHCHACGSYIEHLDQRETDEGYFGAYKCWTVEWYCQSGHLLKRTLNEIHFCRGPA